jgi:hypothetical protein
MLNKSIVLLALSIVGGCVNRYGGSGKHNRAWRVIGVPLCQIGILALFVPVLAHWKAALLTLGLMIGAISSYHYFLPAPAGKNYTLPYYTLYGAVNGLACLPLAWAGIHWYLIIGRAMILAAGLGVLYKYLNIKIGSWTSDTVQERVRGFLICSSIWLLGL